MIYFSAGNQNVNIVLSISLEIDTLLEDFFWRCHYLSCNVCLLFLTFQHNTFYDFIITKARGKSGPLFNFDAYEDIRITQDASVSKDEVNTFYRFSYILLNFSVDMLPKIFYKF